MNFNSAPNWDGDFDYQPSPHKPIPKPGEHFKNTLLDRARRAQRIIECPGKYKICEGCESIVAAKINVCPNCHSYRYESDESLVVAQARALGSREQQSVDPDSLAS